MQTARKPDSVLDDHSSRRRIATPLQQPTRRFRLPARTGSLRLGASGRYARARWRVRARSLPIWSCSVWGLPCGLHCWRPGALLPHLFTLTPGRLHRPLARNDRPWAVSSLLHWPSMCLEAHVPDVIRHTALRSPDFPPPPNAPSPPAIKRQDPHPDSSDHPAACPTSLPQRKPSIANINGSAEFRCAHTRASRNLYLHRI
jgi:hypothetical protein